MKAQVDTERMTARAREIAAREADRLLARTPGSAALFERASRVLSLSGVEGRIEDGSSVLGAGSGPGAEVPTRLVVVSRPGADTLWPALLQAEPLPVVARRRAGETILDLRAVAPEHDEVLARALSAASQT